MGRARGGSENVKCSDQISTKKRVYLKYLKFILRKKLRSNHQKLDFFEKLRSKKKKKIPPPPYRQSRGVGVENVKCSGQISTKNRVYLKYLKCILRKKFRSNHQKLDFFEKLRSKTIKKNPPPTLQVEQGWGVETVKYSVHIFNQNKSGLLLFKIDNYTPTLTLECCSLLYIIFNILKQIKQIIIHLP